MFGKKNNSKKESESKREIDVKNFSYIKIVIDQLLNDKDIKKQFTEIKDTFENGLKEMSKIELENFKPKKLYHHEFDCPIVLKDVIEISNKYKDDRATAIALHYYKNSKYVLLTIFFLGKKNKPFIDINEDTFINLQSSEVSEDLKTLLGGKNLVILK